MPALSVSRLVSTALIAAALVAGQSVQPSNATLDGSESQTEFQLGLDTAPPSGSQFYTIAPLTADVGKGADGQNNGVQVRRPLPLGDILCLVLFKHLLT
jgi:hypothetical protein